MGPDPKGAASAALGLKVMQFIDVAVKNIGDMGVVQGKLDELAQRHTKYGAKKAHFGVSANAFCSQKNIKFNGRSDE